MNLFGRSFQDGVSIQHIHLCETDPHARTLVHLYLCRSVASFMQSLSKFRRFVQENLGDLLKKNAEPLLVIRGWLIVSCCKIVDKEFHTDIILQNVQNGIVVSEIALK